MIPCIKPGLDHVHWTLHPARRYTLEASCAGVGHILPAGGGDSRLAMLGDLVLCGPGGPHTPDVVSEGQALTEMLDALPSGPAARELRDELVSRLLHITRAAA
ncbi:hypothetical protein ACFOWE_17935 [Planomonospora corallina]|uniref:Uncharacterized protein n=1 Tax=Planomonospora corallina TaxID=1806052 RepID=A0ABV8IB73_9ACTN